jgi:hypothetical protein
MPIPPPEQTKRKSGCQRTIAMCRGGSLLRARTVRAGQSLNPINSSDVLKKNPLGEPDRLAGVALRVRRAWPCDPDGRAWPCACGTAWNRVDLPCATTSPRFPAVRKCQTRWLGRTARESVPSRLCQAHPASRGALAHGALAHRGSPSPETRFSGGVPASRSCSLSG